MRFFRVLGIMGLSWCLGHGLAAAVDKETHMAADKLGARAVTELGFEADSATLSDQAKKELNKVISDAQKNGQITSVRIAAWSDQEYPPKDVSLAKYQRDLAENRAKTVQDYLENDLSVSHITKFNMAERPTALQEAFNTNEAKTKNAMEEAGSAPTTDTQKGLFNLKGKASRVVVMVSYK